MNTSQTKTNPIHIMFDIETMGLLPSAALTQVGVIAFKQVGVSNEVLSEQVFNVSPDHWGDNGRSFSGSTVAWWFNQAEAARKSITSGLLSQKSVVEAFHRFVSNNLDKEEGFIWSKGNLDIIVMEDLFRVHGLPCPWKYWQVRDLRTLLWIADPKLERTGVQHDALDDARFQLRQLEESLKKIEVV